MKFSDYLRTGITWIAGGALVLCAAIIILCSLWISLKDLFEWNWQKDHIGHYVIYYSFMLLGIANDED